MDVYCKLVITLLEMGTWPDLISIFTPSRRNRLVPFNCMDMHQKLFRHASRHVSRHVYRLVRRHVCRHGNVLVCGYVRRHGCKNHSCGCVSRHVYRHVFRRHAKLTCGVLHHVGLGHCIAKTRTCGWTRLDIPASAGS